MAFLPGAAWEAQMPAQESFTGLANLECGDTQPTIPVHRGCNLTGGSGPSSLMVAFRIPSRAGTTASANSTPRCSTSASCRASRLDPLLWRPVRLRHRDQPDPRPLRGALLAPGRGLKQPQPVRRNRRAGQTHLQHAPSGLTRGKNRARTSTVMPFLATPARKPRTLWGAQPAAAAMRGPEAPSVRRSRFRTCCCLVPSRGLRGAPGRARSPRDHRTFTRPR